MPAIPAPIPVSTRPRCSMWSNYTDCAGRSRHHCRLRHLAGDDEPLRPAVSRCTSSSLNRQLRVGLAAPAPAAPPWNLDGTTTLEPSRRSCSRRWTHEHWLLQYDLMFGKGYALTRMGLEGRGRARQRQISKKLRILFGQNRRKPLATVHFVCAMITKALHTHHYALLCPYGVEGSPAPSDTAADHGVRRQNKYLEVILLWQSFL